MKQPSVNIKNKRATFDYELMDTYTAGIVLTGTEIKSIRLGKASLVDTFCYFAKGGEVDTNSGASQKNEPAVAPEGEAAANDTNN